MSNWHSSRSAHQRGKKVRPIAAAHGTCSFQAADPYGRFAIRKIQKKPPKDIPKFRIALRRYQSMRPRSTDTPGLRLFSLQARPEHQLNRRGDIPGKKGNTQDINGR
ncbi:hypothetical protein RmaAA213_09310 [Rhodothermus marinus]|nr:hypothetical protein RmaAA213_09310 [Rhodothermus marinus]